ncbi:UDP-N-acetylmuramoyl-L-alanine--D-glutamate ligase [Gimesia sp.]|uniref:UDP-N-acetylmuramoyl-L-alanine--D-glutamate ligase n=1 Tax=Gimesia sp. TaxID=2024833 RepID=UPI003A8ED688
MRILPYFIQNEDLVGKHVAVLGLGKFGGGVATVRFLVERGARVTVIDAKPAQALQASLQELKDCSDVTFQLGDQSPGLPDTDLLVVNPAIPPGHALLREAARQQIPVTSEIELFWQLNPGRVIGVTGSNGKSTTTAMIHCILKAAGKRCWLGGNIGISLLPVLEQVQSEDWVVLELSSFQLDALNRIHVSPKIAVVTNFSPNHLDWHQTLAHYRQAKQTILRWQTGSDVAVLNQDDPELHTWHTRGNILDFGTHAELDPDLVVDQEQFLFKEKMVSLTPRLKVPGAHNRTNAAAAMLACRVAGIAHHDLKRGLESFTGLPHRLEFIGEYQQRKFYNDSLATTPESAICALKAFQDDPLILLAGGSNKQVDLTEFVAQLQSQTKATALMGQTGKLMHDSLQVQRGSDQNKKYALISQPQATFEAAFDWAFQQSAPGDVILLSPGCASYDWFSSFVERGERFIALFRRLSTHDESD